MVKISAVTLNLSHILGYHMTSPKFKLRNYRYLLSFYFHEVLQPLKNLYYWAACGRPSRYFGFWSFSYKNEHPGEETHEVWDRETVFSQVVSYDFLLHKYFCFFFVCLTAFSRIIFSIPFGASSHQIVDKRNLTEFSFQAFITEFKFRSNLG